MASYLSNPEDAQCAVLGHEEYADEYEDEDEDEDKGEDGIEDVDEGQDEDAAHCEDQLGSPPRQEELASLDAVTWGTTPEETTMQSAVDRITARIGGVSIVNKEFDALKKFVDKTGIYSPTKEQRVQLMAETGLTKTQLFNWFKYKRTSKKEAMTSATRLRIVEVMQIQHEGGQLPSPEELALLVTTADKLGIKHNLTEQLWGVLKKFVDTTDIYSPTKEQKVQLVKDSGLTMGQVNGWFKRHEATVKAATTELTRDKAAYVGQAVGGKNALTSKEMAAYLAEMRRSTSKDAVPSLGSGIKDRR